MQHFFCICKVHHSWRGWGPFLLLTGWHCRPQLLAAEQPSGEECSLFATTKSLFVMFPWITYSCVASRTGAPDTADMTASFTESWSLPGEMEYLLVSHCTKTGSSTIYKLNINFHYFTWHNWQYLATDKRDPTGAFRKPALAKANSSREGNKICMGGSSQPASSALLPLIHPTVPPRLRPKLTACPKWLLLITFIDMSVVGSCASSIIINIDTGQYHSALLFLE